MCDIYVCYSAICAVDKGLQYLVYACIAKVQGSSRAIRCNIVTPKCRNSRCRCGRGSCGGESNTDPALVIVTVDFLARDIDPYP